LFLNAPKPRRVSYLLALRWYRQIAVLASMALSSALCMSMLTARVLYTRDGTYTFLAWNLGLAWLPLISAFIAKSFHQRPHIVFRLLLVGCSCLWLTFLPNAPYLITDLIHLRPRHELAFWFDLTMFIAFAWTGLLLGLVSLYWMKQVVRHIAGAWTSWVFVLVVSGLCGFGVYLGRFQNWNSWDIVTNPTELLLDIWQQVRHPIANYQTFAFSGLFALFLITAYLMLNVITRLPQEA
jgi:uncharacterized membrane protein